MAVAKLTPEQTIKTYKMVEGDYTVQVRVLECNDLVPTVGGFSIFKSKGSACDSMVQVMCMGKKKVTKVKKGQLSPIFNQQFTFKFENMKKQQLKDGTITLTVLDKKAFKNAIIGQYELDLSSVYFSFNHELYRTYMTLSDPTDERLKIIIHPQYQNREGIMGYVLVNIAVLGPNDEPVVHTVQTDKKPDTQKDKSMVPSKIKQFPHSLNVKLFRGEHMVPLDVTSPEIDAYVQIKYGGVKIRSNVVTSRNPEWNEELNIGLMLPNQSKFITFEVFDKDTLGDDDMVGTFKLNFRDVMNKLDLPPMWANLYGPPLYGKGQHADLMTLHGDTLGSHYRGRILMQVSSYDERDSKTEKKNLHYKFPERPEPVCEQRSYILRIDLIEAHELPQRQQCYIHVLMGPYLLCSKPIQYKNGSVFFYEALPDKKVLFPKDITQVPDIIFYFADEHIQDRRHCFLRVKAKDILDVPIKPQVIKFREDKSLDLVTDDEFPGFLYANVQLMSLNPGPRKPFVPDLQEKVDYELRVFLYLGRNLPPSDACGTSDPFVKIRCAGVLKQSKICQKTLNPGWYETLTLDVKLFPLDKPCIVPAGMFVMVFDADDETGEKCDLIGRIWITLEPDLVSFQPKNGSPIDLLYRKPKWFHIVYDATHEVQGQILLSYALVKKEDAHLVPQEDSIYPKCEKTKLNIFCIGLRNIDEMVDGKETEKCSISFDISGDANDPFFTDSMKVKACGININRAIEIDLDVPHNQNFCPVLDVYAWEGSKPDPKERRLLGIQTIQLGHILTNYYRRRAHPGVIIEEDESDEDEMKLMNEIENKEKGVQAATAKEQQQQVGDVLNQGELDKIDLIVPWELPIKRKLMEANEYKQRKKELEEERKKIEELIEEEDQSPSPSVQGQVYEFSDQVDRDLQPQPENPIYQATIFNQGGKGQGSSNIQKDDSQRSLKEQFMLFQAPPKHRGEQSIGKEMEAQPVQNSQKQSSKKSSFSDQGYLSKQFQQKIQNADQQSQKQQQISEKVISQQDLQPWENQFRQSESNRQQQKQQPQVDQQQEFGSQELLPGPIEENEQLVSPQLKKEQPEDQHHQGSEKQKLYTEQRVFRPPPMEFEGNDQKIHSKQRLDSIPSQQQVNNQQNVNQQQNQSQQSRSRQGSQLGQIGVNHQDRERATEKKQSQISQQGQVILQGQSKRPSQSSINNQQQIQKEGEIPLDGPKRRPSQIQNDFRSQGSYQSIKFLQEVDHEVLIDQDLHYKNQGEGSMKQINFDAISIKSGKSGKSQISVNSKISASVILEKSYIPQKGQSNLLVVNGSQKIIKDVNTPKNLSVSKADSHRKSQLLIHSKSKFGSQQQISLTHEQVNKLPDRAIYTTFQVGSQVSFAAASKVSSHALSVNSMPKDNLDAKPDPTKRKQIKKKPQFKDNLRNKFAVFGFGGKKPSKRSFDVETYEEFDTEPDEDLDITPEWKKDRIVIFDDLEDKIKPSRKFMKFTLKRGQSRGSANLFSTEKPSEPNDVCDLKVIFLEDKPDIESKKLLYTKLMKQKPYIIRLYILEGVNIQYESEEPPDLYIKIVLAGTRYDVSTQTIRYKSLNPFFYFAYEMPCEIPGPSVLKIEIYAKQPLEDELVGFTEIDLEDRYFCLPWHQLLKKPIETRNLKDESGSSVGRLSLWVDMIEKEKAKKDLIIKIEPPPHLEFELRSIVWEAKNCVFKDEIEKCNDLYARGGVANQDFQETDTHWRCRAKGSWNWRIKNKVFFPMLPDEYGTDKYKMQLWDKDIIGSNELIGETTLDVNIHKMIQKAVKRKAPVKMLQRIREKGGQITDRFWLNVFHPDAVDEDGNQIVQGQVCCSFELLPMEEAVKKNNGLGRDSPNAFPPLAEPVGRLSFDLANPLAFIKDLMGPDLYSKLCHTLIGCACFAFFCTFGWIFFTQVLSGYITS